MLGILSACYQGLDDLFWFPRAQAGITTLNILCVTGRKEMRENWHTQLQITPKVLRLVLTKRWNFSLINSEHIVIAKKAPRTLWLRSFRSLEVTGKMLHHFVMHRQTAFVLQSFLFFSWTSLPNCTHFICEERFIMEHNFEGLTSTLVHGPCRSDSKKFILAVAPAKG